MADDTCDRGGEERVGRGLPPKKDQIKLGEVRNPWGRAGKPRAQVDFMDQLIEMRLDGKIIKVPRRLALDYALFNSALTKPRTSAVKELEHRSRERARAAEEHLKDAGLSPDEQATLDRYMQRRLKTLEAEAEQKKDQCRSTAAEKFDPRCKK